MKRHQQILLAVLVVQIVLSVITFWPKKATTEGGEVVFPNLEVNDVVTITITNEDNQSITLSKESGTWSMAGTDNYPAKTDAIDTLLEKLTKLTRGNLVAETNVSHKQLQVDGEDFVRRIEITLTNGESYQLYLGSAPRYTATHFRVFGEMETYLTTQLSTWEITVTPSSWIDTVYVEKEQATLTEVVLENASGTYTFFKNEGTWSLADLGVGETVAAGKINTIISKAARITMLEPLGKTAKDIYGFGAPLARATVTTEDGESYVISVGAKNITDNSYYVKSSTSDYYISVSDFGVSPLVEYTRADFLEVPEESTATP